MYKNIRIFIISFLILGTIGVSGTASAEVDISKFNSAVSVELGKSADMDTLYQRADQIYDVVEHDDSHIIWRFTGTTGDYAFIFADGRLAVCSMAKFDLAAKDTLEKQVNGLIDLIDIIAGVTQDERDQAVDHAVYYASEAGVYQRIKHTRGAFKLSVPDCTIKNARVKFVFLNDAYYKLIINGEQIANGLGKKNKDKSFDITSNIPSGVHDISYKCGDSSTGRPVYIEAYTTPATKKMVLYSDDYKTWVEDTTQSVTLDQLPGFIGSAAPRDTNAELSTTPTEPYAKISTASVNLHGEKTDVVLGEDVLLKLSAVNLITKPTMHVQVIIIPPSGMSVTSSEFVQSGAGQFTTTYELDSGKGRDIEVRIKSNQVGDFDVDGRIIYYFGDDVENSEDHTLTLPINVRAEADGQNPTPQPSEPSPGFGLIATFFVILLVSHATIKR